MTTHQVLRLVHLIGAIGWVGSGIGLLALGRAQLAAGDLRGMWSFVRSSDALGRQVFMPAGILTVGSGIAMVATQSAFGFTDLWILLGIAGIVASGVIQMTMAAPSERQFNALAEEHGTEAVELIHPARRMSRAASFDVALLLLVVGVMVFRPGA
jgi:hypothetical protein